MLLTQFLLVNLHFVISLLAALVTFAVFWLYFDAWLSRKEPRGIYEFIGFLLLSISFVVQSTIVEQSLLARSILGGETMIVIKTVTRILGYLALIVGQIVVPLQPPPVYRKVRSRKRLSVKALSIFPIVGFSVSQFASFLLPPLAAIAGFLYLRRATVGFERHLKPASLGLFILALAELFGLSSLFRSTDNITVFNWVAPFGPLWIFERVLLVIAMFVLGRWVWGYLLKRFENQLFIVFTTLVLLIFLVTTVFFTLATLGNIRQDTLSSLETDVGVLGYTVESKKAEMLADAQVIAQNPDIGAAVVAQDKKKLTALTVPTFLARKQATLVIVSEPGVVLARAEEPERVGDSLSNDFLVRRALSGESISSVLTADGVIAPIVSVKAAVPILQGKILIGAVMVGTDIDNAYVDGVKKATGLDASVYADNVRSATTFLAPDGKTRWIGVREETESVKKTVLEEGQIFSGPVDILNVPYFAVYAPLNDADSNPIGMLFVGRPQVSILQTASRSIELTFAITAVLMVLSVAPAYWVSKYISYQIG